MAVKIGIERPSIYLRPLWTIIFLFLDTIVTVWIGFKRFFLECLKQSPLTYTFPVDQGFVGKIWIGSVIILNQMKLAFSFKKTWHLADMEQVGVCSDVILFLM